MKILLSFLAATIAVCTLFDLSTWWMISIYWSLVSFYWYNNNRGGVK